MKMTEEEQELFEERLAIIMVDGKMSESYARIKAWEQIKALREKKAIGSILNKQNAVGK